MKTILAAVDFSGITESVVSTAVQLARALEGKVVLLSVVQPPLVATEYAPYVDNLADIEAAADDSVERRLAETKTRLAAEQVPIEVMHLKGPPVANITEVAAERNADYIVMGSHGHTAFYDLLVGSTTHGVLLRAPCPVVIVPPKSGRRPIEQKPARALAEA